MSALGDLVVNARLQAATGLFDGTELTGNYLAKCRHIYKPMEAIVIFTRDIGYHSGGWWKNPDYERCFHLSVSFQDGSTKKKRELLAKAFFESDAKLTWVEPPSSKEGRIAGVWHYRLFCDEGWKPMKPDGEVYTPKMPAGWKSFSEKHG